MAKPRRPAATNQGSHARRARTVPRALKRSTATAAEQLDVHLWLREIDALAVLHQLGLPDGPLPASLPNVPANRRMEARMLSQVLEACAAVRELAERGDAPGAAYAMYELEDAWMRAELGHDLERRSMQRFKTRTTSASAGGRARARKFAEERAVLAQAIRNRRDYLVQRGIRPTISRITEELAAELSKAGVRSERNQRRLVSEALGSSRSRSTDTLAT